MRKLRIAGLALLLMGLAWPARTTAAGQRVGLQVGHWESSNLPDELRRLRTSTGAVTAGYRESQVNYDIAQRTAALLRAAGLVVDVLPATIPPNYRADAFVSLHADGSASSRSSGFKIATHWREWAAGVALVDALRAEYGPASGLRWDGGRITSNMRGYYAFGSGRYDHAISSYTPGVILEMGYLTNPGDRALMVNQPDRLARGIANGILRFLSSEPAGGWPAPPPPPEYRAFVTVASANLRSGPGTNFPVVRNVSRGRVMLVEEVRGDWLKLTRFRNRGSERWVHRGSVRLDRLRDDPPQDS